MSDIRLFRIAGAAAVEIQGTATHLEKPLQTLIESNLDPLLGIRFLATEYSTGKTHAGRIDTLGIDENNSPVIIEYKRSSSENVINQGLFYLDWLMDHQAEFKLLVLERFDKAAADAIDWSAPRLICIAADFTKYDGHAVQQMNHNIELIRYRRFGQDLLLLELVNAVATGQTVKASPSTRADGAGAKAPKSTGDKTIAEWLQDMPDPIRVILESLERYILSLGDDIQRKDLKLYIAFKRLKNFATVCFLKHRLAVNLKLNPDEVELVEGFSRDVRQIGHWGTGDTELWLKTLADLDRAKPLILRAYQGGQYVD